MNAEKSARSNTRRRALGMILGAAALAGAFATAYQLLIGRHHISSDNAYVAGDRIQITPQTGGTLVAVYVEDTQRVEAGELIAQLDASDAEVTLERARANLAQRVLDVRTLAADADSLRAQISEREAQLQLARTESDRAGAEYQRRASLARTGAISGEALDNATSDRAAAAARVIAAEAAVHTAKQQLAAQQLRLGDAPIEQHPAVLEAAAQMREAWMRVQRCRVLAPVSGFVTQRSAQVGERVEPGHPLMTIVPLDSLWVDANLKENQLGKLRIGQPVVLEADMYGRDVEYHGSIAGIGSGTGAAFSLLPAQNATGNWIKVVQRVPVRIRLEPDTVAAHPLRVGLSMHIDIDVHNQDLPQLDSGIRTVAARTQIYDALAAQASSEVSRIISAQLARTP